MKELIDQLYVTYHELNYFEQMSKLIVDLGQRKGINNKPYSKKLFYVQNTLKMGTADTPENKDKIQIVSQFQELCAY